MKLSTIIAIFAWVVVIGGNVFQVLFQPSPIFQGDLQFPWYVVFMPLFVVVGAYFTPDLPGEFTIGKFVDEHFGRGTYRQFMSVLRLELLFSTMCFSIALCGFARAYLLKEPGEPLVINGFFASGGASFLLAYFIRRRRDKSAAEPIGLTPVAEQSSQNAIAFWLEVRRRRNTCWIVFPSWLVAGPILLGLYSLILPQSPFEARGFAALLTWGGIMIWAQQRLKQLRCYNCGRQAFSNPMFLWNYAKCRNCGVSPQSTKAP